MADPGFYTVGGTVQAGGGIYIPRQADEELLQLCRDRVFAYVLTPRQMGKSSLMVRTAEQLQAEGVRTAIVDLQDLGAQVTAEQWYFGFLVKLEDQLELETDAVNWWQERQHLSVSQRLTMFFDQVLLQEIDKPLVIFVDEIDSTLSLDFTDDFFIAIRSLYVTRATQPTFQRLSFVLIGVATPGDLIRDVRRTPFNIGRRVDLTDFTLKEAMPLAAGLGLAGTAAEQTLNWVLEWTGGHPYLTQRLCQEMAQVGGSQWIKQDVDRLVASTFLGTQSEQDNNLQFVRDMLTKRAPEPVALLEAYRDVRRGTPPVVDEEQSLVKSHLKLSGVVKREGKTLRIRNRIYHKAFDSRWIRTHLSNTSRPYILLKFVVLFLVFLLTGSLIAIHLLIINRANLILYSDVCKQDPEVKGLLEYMWLTGYANRLNNVQLCNEDMRGIELPGVVMLYTDFDTTNLANSNFRGAKLAFSIFRGANLAYADFSEGAVLTGVDFRCKAAGCTTLIGANFENSDLSQANFQGAFLEGATFKGSNLTGVRGLTEKQLEGAILCRTKMPDYLGYISGNRDCHL